MQDGLKTWLLPQSAWSRPFRLGLWGPRSPRPGCCRCGRRSIGRTRTVGGGRAGVLAQNVFRAGAGHGRFEQRSGLRPIDVDHRIANRAGQDFAACRLAHRLLARLVTSRQPEQGKRTQDGQDHARGSGTDHRIRFFGKGAHHLGRNFMDRAYRQVIAAAAPARPCPTSRP
jgi:hypothetical protein